MMYRVLWNSGTDWAAEDRRIAEEQKAKVEILKAQGEKCGSALSQMEGHLENQSPVIVHFNK